MIPKYAAKNEYFEQNLMLNESKNARYMTFIPQENMNTDSVVL